MRALNPGYKLLTLMIVSLMLSFTFHIRVNLLVCAVSLLATVMTPGVNRKRLALTMLPFLLAALGMFTTGLLYGKGDGIELDAFNQQAVVAQSVTSGMQLASRILAFGGVGLLFAYTTNSMDLIMSLMQQFHLPPKFAYGILAAYHFFPVVKQEFSIVGAALRVRGIRALPVSPKRIFPMLVHALERSESLAMAMESRGFQNDAPRAVAFRVPFRPRDIAFLIAVPALVALGLVLL